MKIPAYVILTCFCVVLSFSPSFRAWSDDMPTGYDTCTGRTYCAVVFLAPWCPICQQEVPLVKAMLERSRLPGDTGMRVIVGKADIAQCNLMAQQIALGTTVDKNQKIANQIGAQFVPFYKVFDQSGATIAGGPNARTWMIQKLGH